jgi:hypothetical protein
LVAHDLFLVVVKSAPPRIAESRQPNDERNPASSAQHALWFHRFPAQQRRTGGRDDPVTIPQASSW